MVAEMLLSMALGGIVGNAASDGVRALIKQLRQKIVNRLQQSNPTMEAEILEAEQNPTEENLKLLEPFLQVEMHKDKQFAAEISQLGEQIAASKEREKIEIKDFEAKDNAVVAGKIDAPHGIGVYHNYNNLNLGKD